MLLRLIVAGLLLLPRAVGKAGGVVELTDATFEGKVLESEKDLWLVEFYAPWCTHCRRLSPILDDAAKRLSQTLPHIHIGKLDATVHPNTTILYGVKGYPTLLFFKEGMHGKYEGPRTSDAIVSFMTKLSSEAWIELRSLEELTSTLSDVGHAYVLTLPTDQVESSTDKLISTFKAVSKKRHYKAHFAIHYSSSEPVTLSKMEPGRRPTKVPIDGLDEDQLLAFVDSTNRPLISEIDSHNFKSLASHGLPLLLLIRAPGSSSLDQIFNEEISEVDKRADYPVDELFVAGRVDGVRWRRFFLQYEVTALPSLLLLDVAQEQFLGVPLPPGDSEAREEIRRLLQAVKEGSLPLQTLRQRTVLQRLVQKVRAYFPWSLLALLPLVLGLVSLCLPHPDYGRKGKTD